MGMAQTGHCGEPKSPNQGCTENGQITKGIPCTLKTLPLGEFAIGEPTALRDITAPTLQPLGSGFWQCVIHARGRVFRGLSNDPEEAKARALTLSAAARGLGL